MYTTHAQEPQPPQRPVTSQQQKPPLVPPLPRAIKAPFGWRVHPAALVLASLAVLFAFVGGGLLVLSIWFMIFGVPVAIAAFPAGFGLLRYRSPGAPRPSIFVYVLGLVELGMAFVLWLYLRGSPDALLVIAIASAPGLVTLLIGFVVDATTSERTAPPPTY